MYIALSYDISSKKGLKIRKVCEKYLSRVQKSVFEGEITERQLGKLKAYIQNTISFEEDSVIIYYLNSFNHIKKESIGVIKKSVSAFI